MAGTRVKPPQAEVAAVLDGYPAKARRRLLALRRLILRAAAETPGVGPLTETLKWREPAYLTAASGSGSTIRIAWKPRAPERYGMYFNCNTDLVGRFRGQFADVLSFEGNRAIILDLDKEPPEDALAVCIAAALTYHADRKRRRRT